MFFFKLTGSDTTSSPQQSRHQTRIRQNELTNVINLGGGSVTPGKQNLVQQVELSHNDHG